MAAKNNSKNSFEDALRRLEEIVDKLERGEIPLEESIKMYEEGLALSKTCIEKLTQADLKLKRMVKSMDGTFQFLDEDTE